MFPHKSRITGVVAFVHIEQAWAISLSGGQADITRMPGRNQTQQWRWTDGHWAWTMSNVSGDANQPPIIQPANLSLSLYQSIHRTAPFRLASMVRERRGPRVQIAQPSNASWPTPWPRQGGRPSRKGPIIRNQVRSDPKKEGWRRKGVHPAVTFATGRPYVRCH